MTRGLRVESIDRMSRAARRGVGVGHRLIAVNGREVNDDLDLIFEASGEERVQCLFEREGERLEVELPQGDWGITWGETETRLCRSKCVFCYVHQNPKGMRRPIYVMDEDLRLSFLFGSFTTLSNLSDADRRRIVAQRLSPLYVSVHATDERVRESMLRLRARANRTPILDDIDFFVAHGIELHTQTVLCPGINDTAVLERTVRDLAARRPLIRSLACVPVGLTAHRKNLPRIRPFDRAAAASAVARIEELDERLDDGSRERFVYAADELYCIAGLDPPPLEHYGDLEQLDNGVGLIRYWEEIITEALADLRPAARPRRVLALTGMSAHGHLEAALRAAERDHLELRLDAVPNRLFGDTVTVANLLAGADLLAAIDAALRSGFDPHLVLLPPKILNSDRLFLDDLSFDEARARAGVELAPAPDDPRELARMLGGPLSG